MSDPTDRNEIREKFTKRVGYCYKGASRKLSYQINEIGLKVLRKLQS